MIGSLRVTIRDKNQEVQSKIYVIEGLKQNLLDKPEISKFGLIREINRMQNSDARGIVSGFAEMFTEVGQFQRKLRIEIKEDAIPFFQAVPRTVPIPLFSKLKKELDKLLKL